MVRWSVWGAPVAGAVQGQDEGPMGTERNEITDASEFVGGATGGVADNVVNSFSGALGTSRMT